MATTGIGSWNYTVPNAPQPNYGTQVTPTPWTYTPTPNSAATTAYQQAKTPTLTAGTVQPPPDMWGAGPGVSPGIQGPIFNLYDPTVWSDATKLGAVTQYLANWYTPQQQLSQNSYQWGKEYDEAARQYNMNYDLQNQINQYNMALQTRQQQAAEWEAQQAAEQWGQQFDWTKMTDEWSRALAQQQTNYEEAQALAQANKINTMTPAELAYQQAQTAYQQAQTGLLPQQYALQEREQTMQEREQAYQEAYRQQQLAQAYQLAVMQQQAALQQANVAAFGRAQRPNARYMRNWG